MARRDTAYDHWRALGLVLAPIGATVLLTLLGLPLAISSGLWDWASVWKVAYFAGAVLTVLVIGGSLYLVLAPIYGWRVPQTHDEKRALEEERALAEIERVWKRRLEVA